MSKGSKTSLNFAPFASADGATRFSNSTSIDRIGPEWHELSKKSKDMGSAAVLLSVVLAVGIWLAALHQKFLA